MDQITILSTLDMQAVISSGISRTRFHNTFAILSTSTHKEAPMNATKHTFKRVQALNCQYTKLVQCAKDTTGD